LDYKPIPENFGPDGHILCKNVEISEGVHETLELTVQGVLTKYSARNSILKFIKSLE
jgi:hypothetical protein